MQGNSFGANEWLVDGCTSSIYRIGIQSTRLWDFFADYVPSDPARAAALKTRIDQAKAARTPAKAAPESDRRHPGDLEETTVLRGPAARVVTNMEASLGVPTATSVRAVPAKLLIDNRVVINNHLGRKRRGRSASPT